MNEENYKIIILGDCSVGKSNIIIRYIKNKFEDNLQPTIGIEFYTKKIIDNNKKIKINIWDTAGQERFQSITNSYFKGTDIILLVYDITNYESFTNLKKWIEMINKSCNNNYILAIIGNKVDLIDKRKVSKNEGIAFSKLNDSIFFEISAKEGTKINNMFENVIKQGIKSKNFAQNDSLMNFSIDNNILLKKEEIINIEKNKYKYCKC